MQPMAWNETDALYTARTGRTLAQVMLANRPELAAELGVETEEAGPALAVVEDEPGDDCASGSCQLARPGGSCDCSCGGAQHGARSTLAPAACAGTRLLVEVAPDGGYRYPRCPGCSGCRRPRLVLVDSSRDPFARLPHVEDFDPATW